MPPGFRVFSYSLRYPVKKRCYSDYHRKKVIFQQFFGKDRFWRVRAEEMKSSYAWASASLSGRQNGIIKRPLTGFYYLKIWGWVLALLLNYLGQVTYTPFGTVLPTLWKPFKKCLPFNWCHIKLFIYVLACYSPYQSYYVVVINFILIKYFTELYENF